MWRNNGRNPPSSSVYNLASENQTSLLGPLPASYYNQHWKSLQTLYPLMKFHKEWKKPKVVSESGENPLPEDGFICDISFSGDGKKMIAGSSIGHVHLFDPNIQKCVSTMTTSHFVVRVCFAGNTQFATGLSNSSILLWDVRNTKVPVNTLLGHSKLIRGLDYDEQSHQLISTSYDCDVRYWHIPSYQVERGNYDSAETMRYRGTLLKCPNMEQTSMNFDGRRMVCVNTKGVVFSISNLDLDHVNEDLGLVRLDDTLPLLLSWITPNASTDRRNAIKIIEGMDYNPLPNSIVSRIHHILLHPTLPLLIIRFCTTSVDHISVTKKDWLSVYSLQEAVDITDLAKSDTARAYGIDIMCEPLLYNSEVSRYCVLSEKKVCFSRDGRLIASPNKNGIDLLAFSNDLDFPNLTSKGTSVDALFEPDFFSNHGTPCLHTVLQIPRNSDSVMCTKFSESCGGLLLAAGERDGKLSFHIPKL